MRTLQEWMGNRDLATTQIYADYAPSTQEAAMVAAAFARRVVESPGDVPASSPMRGRPRRVSPRKAASGG